MFPKFMMFTISETRREYLKITFIVIYCQKIMVVGTRQCVICQYKGHTKSSLKSEILSKPFELIHNSLHVHNTD